MLKTIISFGAAVLICCSCSKNSGAVAPNSTAAQSSNNGLQVTTVDVLGNYSGGMAQDSAPKDSKAIYRLRAAIIDTPKGSYFVKLTGPEKTVGHWEQAYSEYIKSFEFK